MNVGVVVKKTVADNFVGFGYAFGADDFGVGDFRKSGDDFACP